MSFFLHIYQKKLIINVIFQIIILILPIIPLIIYYIHFTSSLSVIIIYGNFDKSVVNTILNFANNN